MTTQFDESLRALSPNRAIAIHSIEYLIDIVQQLSLAPDLTTIMDIVCQATRDLTQADGASFVLRDGDLSYYANENAIGPLWKGKRFPMDSCIGGWCIAHAQPVLIQDVFQDERIPEGVYEPTFIKSLIMVPIREIAPIGAIGTYWAQSHTATAKEVQLLQSLANATAIAIERQQTATELQQKTDELEELYNNAPCGYHSLDANGIFVRINDTELTMLGYTREEILGRKTFAELLTPESLVIFRANFPRFQQDGLVNDLNFQMIRKDGSILPISLSATAIYDQAGNYLKSRSIVLDISDRVQAETQLQVTEARLRYLLSTSPAVLYACQTADDYAATFVSENVREMLGYDSRAFLNDSHFWASHIHPEDAPEIFAGLSHLFKQGTHRHEYRFQHQDGHYLWVHDELRLVRDDQGNPLEIVGYWIDITERKQAEQKIQEQAALLDIATDAIWVCNLDRQIVYWNQGAERLYGWSAIEALGQNIIEFLSPQDLTFIAPADQTLHEQGSWQGEIQELTKTRQKITIESRWTLVRDEFGEPKAVLGVGTDITQKKQLEAQFLRVQRLESLGTLASGIAHDMNNVLTPILATSQLLPLKLPNLDERSQLLLQMLEESAKRGTHLVQQILSFARGSDGTRTSVQLEHILAEVVRVTRQTFPKSIEIVMQLPEEELWMVPADATQIHQVLMNLLINARDAMLEGGMLTIEAENLVLDENYTRMHIDAQVGAYVVLTIADTGSGIPPEILERIFEPFFTTKDPGKGTGLGLSTTLGIVKNHGGFVNAYSDLGKGTRFKIYLPAEVNAESILAIDSPDLPIGHEELILVVDDELSVREITKASLETYHYRVMTASDGIEAIALFAQRSTEISYVLLDLMMPSLDSASTIRALQKINDQVPIVVMSGLSANEPIKNMRGVNVEAFLAKPFTSQELLQTLHRLRS